MNCYIITYDLRNGGNYTSLHNAIKQYGTWAKITESTWAVVTEKSASAIRDNLLSFMDNNDRLFVIKSGGEAAWTRVICKNEWLQKHLPDNNSN
ncbi:MAG: CRISPR-associated protein Cas2 [Flavobacterium sp.]